MTNKPHKFPDPNDYALKDMVVFCPKDRMVKIYNRVTKNNKSSLAQGIKIWFAEEAVKRGWAGCITVPTVQTKNYAGCMLVNQKSVNLTFQAILVANQG